MKKIILILVISIFTGSLYASNGIKQTFKLKSDDDCTVTVTKNSQGIGLNCYNEPVEVIGTGTHTSTFPDCDAAYQDANRRANQKANADKNAKIAALKANCETPPQP